MIRNNSKRHLKLITSLIITLLFGIILAGCDDSSVEKFNIIVTSNNANYGTVTGGGSYNEGATATLKATPKKDHVFSGWFNGDNIVASEVTYKFTVTEDLRLVGHFGPMEEEKEEEKEESTDFNTFVATINNTFEDAVGLDTVMTTRYEDDSQSMNIMTHLENGKIISAYLSVNDYYRVWIKDDMQYNYTGYSHDEFEVSKYTFDAEFYNNSFYMYGYMVQLLNQLVEEQDETEYEFEYDSASKIYTITVLTENEDDDTIEIKMKVENEQLLESTLEIKYDERQSMTLVEKISYDKASRPILPEVEEHDYVEMFWLTQVEVTGDETKHFTPVNEIPNYLYNDYFDEYNIEGYYYDQAFTQRADYGDILTKDTVIYCKIIDDEKIDLIINFTDPEIAPIELNQVYKWQIIEVTFIIPNHVVREDYIDSIKNQIKDLGIDSNGSSDFEEDKLIIWIIMPNESKTITLD